MTSSLTAIVRGSGCKNVFQDVLREIFNIMLILEIFSCMGLKFFLAKKWIWVSGIKNPSYETNCKMMIGFENLLVLIQNSLQTFFKGILNIIAIQFFTAVIKSAVQW